MKKKHERKAKKTIAPEPTGLAIRHLEALPKFTPGKGIGVELVQLWSQYKTEILGILKSVAFLVIGLLGVLNCAPNLFDANDAYGTHELPTTYTMINSIRGSFYLFSIIIMVYFSGFLVWKERNAKMDEIYDSMPMKNWTVYLGKYLAVLSIMFLLSALMIVFAVMAQASFGYDQYNFSTYIRELLIVDMLGFSFIMALSMLVHSLSKKHVPRLCHCYCDSVCNQYDFGRIKYFNKYG